MITHDGSKLVSKTGVFIKIEDIMYIEGGYVLEGLRRIKPFEIYFRHNKKPLNFAYNSPVKNEIFEALSLNCQSYPNTHPFIVFRNSFIVNMSAVSNINVRNGKDPQYFITFDNGLEVETTPGIYSALFTTFLGAIKLDNEKYVKRSIPGFMETGK